MGILCVFWSSSSLSNSPIGLPKNVEKPAVACSSHKKMSPYTRAMHQHCQSNPVNAANMIEWMNLLGWPLAMLGVGSVIRSYVNHRDEKLDRDVFADETCQILSLPRLVANHRGGVIVADLDNRGNSILIFKRRIIRIPRILVDQDIQAWNITPREARILVQMAWPQWQDENPSTDAS